MNPYQIKILELATTKNLGEYSLREIGELIGISNPHPQTIKNHLEILSKKGILFVDIKRKIIKKIEQKTSQTNLLSIPILGSASAGPANVFAEEYIAGFLKLSPRMLDKRALNKKDQIFILEVSGNSMDQATIGEKGLSARNNDYVVVDGSNRNPQNGQYVLSVIDGMANIKKFVRDKDRISLLSESSENHPPIYIHPEDEYGYIINGVVIQVIKK